MNKNTSRSIGAIFAGSVTVFLPSVGTDLMLQAIGFFPPQSRPIVSPEAIIK